MRFQIDLEAAAPIGSYSSVVPDDHDLVLKQLRVH